MTAEITGNIQKEIIHILFCFWHYAVSAPAIWSAPGVVKEGGGGREGQYGRGEQDKDLKI